jgi:GWxTD domain-containing protein
VEDLGARKRGLLYLITGQHRGSSVTGDLVPPPFVGKAFGTSDLQFAWVVGPLGADSTFAKGSLEVVPNPSRGYGRFQSVLSLYYEIYDGRGAWDGPRTYLLVEDVLNANGAPVLTVVDTVEASEPRWSRVVRFPLESLSHGAYTARVAVRDPAAGEEAGTERRWSLLWKDESWDLSEQDMLDAARVIFEEEEADRFRGMSAGDRELYLQEFWSRMDPTPTTPQNERLEEFRRRVAFANREFSAHGRKGMLTDRGRVHIRFGPADEVERELLPTQDTQLDRQVEDLVKENPTAQILKTEDQFDTRPYEIWTYTRQGEPLFPEREKTTTVTGLRFVFVDDTGTGHYVLMYTSDFLGY